MLSLAIVALLTSAASLLGLLKVYDLPISDMDAAISFMGSAITAAISLLLFSDSQETDRALKSYLRYHRFVPEHDKRSRQARKARAINAMHSSISSLVNDCTILAEMGGKSAGVTETKWRQFKDDFEALHYNAARFAAELQRMLKDADYPDDRTCDDILAVLDLLGEVAPIDDDKRTVDTLQYRAILKSLLPVLDRLERRLDPAASRPSRLPRPAVPPGGLVLSLSRDTYPPGAAIRATVEASGPFPHHKVIVTIHGKGPDALAKKAKDASLQEGRSASVTLDVVPKKRLAAGQEYIARAECGDLYDEVAFAVEHMAPTVRADRRTCAVGDYIAITVVDPTAAAGGTKKGPAGAAKRQSLVVESPCGNTDASSRLREVDHPAGTFRARVRCADAGAVDAGEGAIPCEPDQLIRIRYESAAGKAWTAVLVEGIGDAESGPSPGPSPGDGDGGGGDGPDRPPGEGKSVDELHDTGPKPGGHRESRAGRMPGDPKGRGTGAMTGASATFCLRAAGPQEGDRRRRIRGAVRGAAAPVAPRRALRSPTRAAPKEEVQVHDPHTRGRAWACAQSGPHTASPAASLPHIGHTGALLRCRRLGTTAGAPARSAALDREVGR